MIGARHVPQTATDEGVAEAVQAALGDSILDLKDQVGEVTITISRERIEEVLRALRDTPGLEYQQLMDIAGVDYPDRSDRFEVNYHLLSLTQNRRIRVKLMAAEGVPVPSVTSLWPVAGWLEREVYDMFGVPFAGNPDLRRILTDYNFEGHPFRKDFPLTGHVEMRYSEAEKRVIYEPVSLPQDFRSFDFLMPWEGPEYRLPGDEKAEAQAPGAPTPAPAPATGGKPNVVPHQKVNAEERTAPYAADNEDRAQRGAGQAHAEARKSPKAKAANEVSKTSDIPDPKPTGAGRRKKGGGPA